MEKTPPFPNKPFFHHGEPSPVIKQQHHKNINSEQLFYVESSAYDNCVERVSLTKDHINHLSKIVEDFSSTKPEAVDISIELNLVNYYYNYHTINYSIEVENKHYERELKAYNKQLSEYNTLMEQYEKDLAVYEEYQEKAKLQAAKDLIAKHEAKISKIKKIAKL